MSEATQNVGAVGVKEVSRASLAVAGAVRLFIAHQNGKGAFRLSTTTTATRPRNHYKPLERIRLLITSLHMHIALTT
jgi:hypothetical protein